MTKQISIHEALRKNFVRGGKGVFTCQCCERQTRETNGDHAQTGNCEHCFELAGIENTLSDNGMEVAKSYKAEVKMRLTKLAKMGGKMEHWAELAEAFGVALPTTKEKTAKIRKAPASIPAKRKEPKNADRIRARIAKLQARRVKIDATIAKLTTKLEGK